MPARLHFSNSLDALAERLRANLKEAGGDVLAAPAIATPSPAVRDWLKVRLAEGAGVVAGLSFPHLENLLWNLLAERDSRREDPTRLPARLLDGFGFQGLVLARLRTLPPEALQAYLQGAGPEDRSRRLCQLAGRLASLFREYEYNRVAGAGFDGLIDSWMHDKPSFEPHVRRGTGASRASEDGALLNEVRELETWQREVYHAIFRKDDGLRDRWGEATKTYRYTLPQYANLALAGPRTPKDALRTIHLFGLSNISPFHRDLIGQLADQTRMGAAAARFEIYALNPCAEFWEDVLTLRERRARGPRKLVAGAVAPAWIAATRPDDSERADGAFREHGDENGLLALFGKPGRETIKLWCELTGHDFFEDFREPYSEAQGDRGGNVPLLATVQESVLRREGPRPPENRIPVDDSLRLRRASDARAELEAVRAEIAAALTHDPGLRPEECAIVMADPDKTASLLRAVFAGGAEAPGNVPVLFPDGGPEDESPLMAAFRKALALGSMPLDRTDLIALLDNPGVLRRTELDADHLDAVVRFLEEAGFQEGWEASPLGSGIESCLTRAMERAVLALALDPADPALEALPDMEARTPWPAADAVARLERREMSRLLEWLETLRSLTSPLRDGERRTWEAWAVCLRALRDGLCRPGAEDARAVLDLNRFFDDLEQWGGWCGNTDDSDGGSDRADATLVRMLFEDRFRDTAGAGRPALLRGGVRAAGLAALRGLPFKHVWVTGLTAAFPSPGESAPLDLRGYRRLPGESDPASRDLYALLELITATSHTLTLSYPARDAGGKDTQPSRALTALGAWIESDILAHGNRLDPDQNPLRAPTTKRPPPPPRPAITWAVEERVAPLHDVQHLGQYLENPAWYAARRRFRIDAYDALSTDAPERAAALFLDSRDEKDLLKPALRAELRNAGEGITCFEKQWRQEQRAGKLPREPFRSLAEAAARARLAKDVTDAADALNETLRATGLRFSGSLRLGPQGTASAEPPVLNRPAFEAAFLGIPVKVGGIFPWFFTARNGGENQGQGRVDAQDPHDSGWGVLVEEGQEFPAYLLHLCSLALAPHDPVLNDLFSGTGRVFMRAYKTRKITAHVLPPLDVATARRVLTDLLADATRDAAEGRYGDLPLELIAAVLNDADPESDPVMSTSDWSLALDEARRAAGDASFGKQRYHDRVVEALAPPVPHDAADQIRRRVLPYVRWRTQLTQKPPREEP